MEYALMFPPDGGEPVSAVVIDISLGGLQVKSRSDLPSGVQFLMQIGCGGEAPITTAVEVRHSTSIPNSDLYSIGVRFLPGASEERMRLVQYIHDAFIKQVNLLAAG
jgi:hypothetical protein